MLEGGLENWLPIERLNLVNDAWATTIAGLMPLSDYLDLTGRFALEKGTKMSGPSLSIPSPSSIESSNRRIEPDSNPLSAPESARPLRLSVGQPDRGTTT